MIQIIDQIKEEKSVKKKLEKLIKTINKWQYQIIKLNTYHDQEIQTDEKRDNVTIQLHLDDLMTFDPLNNLSEKKHQSNPFDILLKSEKIDSKEKGYFSYEEMSLGELDSYYFRLD